MYNHSSLRILNGPADFVPTLQIISFLHLLRLHRAREAQGGGATPPLNPDANQILSSNSTSFVSILIEWWEMARRRLSNNDSNIRKNIDPRCFVFLLSFFFSPRRRRLCSGITAASH